MIVEKFTENHISSSIDETPNEKKLRFRSHWVMYATMCFLSTGFSIVISGVFPYLKLLEGDDHLSKTYLGWVIAASPLGAMCSAPIIGKIANRLGSVRYTAYITTIAFAASNVLYGILPTFVGLWQHAPFHMMLIARLLVGLSSGMLVLCRSYLASATTMKERTDAFAIMSASQSIGYIIGPVAQMILSLTLQESAMKYQATGFLSAILGFTNFILMTPFIFNEFDIAAKERSLMQKIAENNSEKTKKIKPDYPALLSVMVGYFLASLIYILIETLLEPLSQDQYAWCDDLAVIAVGVVLSATGLLFLIMFIVAGRLAKVFDERKLLLVGGIGVSTIGLLVFLPWSSTSLKYCSEMEIHILQKNESVDNSSYLYFDVEPYHRDNSTLPNKLFNLYCTEEKECLGCPPHQTWCLDVPQLPFPQLLVGFTIILSVFPISITMTSSLFSKLLGPLPQGTWMGLFTSMGSLARMFGPIGVSYIYSYLGTRYTFSILTIMMICGGIQFIYFYKRIVPLSFKSLNHKGNEFEK